MATRRQNWCPQNELLPYHRVGSFGYMRGTNEEIWVSIGVSAVFLAHHGFGCSHCVVGIDKWCACRNALGRTSESLSVESAAQRGAGAPARDRRECSAGTVWLSTADCCELERGIARRSKPFA